MVALYIDPPAHAVVLWVDEKSTNSRAWILSVAVNLQKLHQQVSDVD